MKCINFYLFMLLSLCSCSTFKTNKIKQLVTTKANVWVSAWQSDPFSGLKKGGWQSTKNEYMYDSLVQIPDYRKLYVYSPSNNLFVDIFSRQLDVEINGRDTLMSFSGELEAEIILSNIKEQASQRLLFTSDGTYFDDVIWIDDNYFIVLGHFTDFYSKQDLPVIMLFDIEKQRDLTYYGKTNKIIKNIYKFNVI